jgi:hypothetical protein
MFSSILNDTPKYSNLNESYDTKLYLNNLAIISQDIPTNSSSKMMKPLNLKFWDLKKSENEYRPIYYDPLELATQAAMDERISKLKDERTVHYRVVDEKAYDDVITTFYFGSVTVIGLYILYRFMNKS